MNDPPVKKDTMDPFYDQMLGKLALSYKMISSEQYAQALGIQNKEASAGNPVLLSDVFFSQGHLSSEQIGILHQAIGIMADRRKKKRFGPLAVSRGIIRNEDLRKALEIQKTLNRADMKPLGLILVDMGRMTEAQVQEILDLQKNIAVSVPSLEEVTAAPQSQNTRPSVLFGDSLLLNVSQDALIAVVGLPERRVDITVAEIQAFLDARGVTFGRMPEDYLMACLESWELGVNAFVGARGQKGQAPISGEAKILFTPRPVEHDKPSIPVAVKAGDVLAERTLMRPGIPRITVFGVGFDEKDRNETFFMNGGGARLNETRDKITAACDGEPFLFADGAVGVLKEHLIDVPDDEKVVLSVEGDVVLNGFAGPGTDIRCVHLSAADIEGAVIVAEGDVRVAGQIVDSRVVAAGTVRADTIQNCTISSLGDVTVVNDILDSTIETSCRCVAGKSVIASTIRARRGIDAEDVASSDGIPSCLEFGIEVLPAIVTADKDEMKNLEAEVSVLVEEIHSIESMFRITDQVIADISQNQKKIEKELTLLKNTVARMEQKSNRQVVTGRNKMTDLITEIQASAETMEVLANDRTDLEKRSDSLKKHLQIKMKIYRELKESMERKTGQMARRLEGLPPVAQVAIRNEIDRGTILKGPHRAKTLENTLGAVTIRETENTDGTWFIQIIAQGS